jgi:hypothetical protein
MSNTLAHWHFESGSTGIRSLHYEGLWAEITVLLWDSRDLYYVTQTQSQVSTVATVLLLISST